MMLFDMIMKGPDSYWKRRYHAEEIRRNRAEADLRYSESIREEQEKDLAMLTRRDVGQAKAIEAFNREREDLRQEIKQRDDEIRMLRECLRAEKEANKALRTSTVLWEQLKKGALKDAVVQS